MPRPRLSIREFFQLILIGLTGFASAQTTELPAGSGGSALDMHQLAFGATATKGRFQDSYLQVGWGRSDTFATARRKRCKVDRYLQWRIPKAYNAAGMSMFAQLFVDTDLGRGSDAIQSYIGVNFDLDKLIHH